MILCLGYCSLGILKCEGRNNLQISKWPNMAMMEMLWLGNLLKNSANAGIGGAHL